MKLRIVLAVAVAALGVAFVTAREPDRSVEQLAARWAPPPSQFLPLQGMQVHLRDEGPREDAVPVVLLHGTAASLHTWDGWTGVLRGTRRVIRVDLPGFGLTGPQPQADYTSAAYVRFVLGVLDALGVQRCVLAGNSLGGNIAWHVAVAAPERVERLVLVDAGGYPRGDVDMPLGFRLAQVPVLAPVLRQMLPRSVIEKSVASVYGDPARITPELIDRYFELTLRAGNRKAVGDRFRAEVPGHDAALIPTIRTPALILWGRRDRLIPPADAERFARDIPGSMLVWFDDLGHVPQEEDPQRTVAALLAWLEG